MSTETPTRPRTRAPIRRYRLAYWYGAISDPNTRVSMRHFSRPEDCSASATSLAAGGSHSTGASVHLEMWDPSHPQDAVNRGWALVGSLAPGEGDRVVTFPAPSDAAPPCDFHDGHRAAVRLDWSDGVTQHGCSAIAVSVDRSVCTVVPL